MSSNRNFIQKELNQHDIDFIKYCEGLHYLDWDLVDLDKAETEEGYKRLRSIKSKMLYKEEAMHGEY